jgi:hypothetical protein
MIIVEILTMTKTVMKCRHHGRMACWQGIAVRKSVEVGEYSTVFGGFIGVL